MAGPADIMAAVGRKYDIEQQRANAQSALENAQAAAVPITTQSEANLRAAQGYATREQGATYGPLAGAQIAGTMAGIPESLARAGYYGSMGHETDVRAGTLGPLAQSTIASAGAGIGVSHANALFEATQARMMGGGRTPQGIAGADNSYQNWYLPGSAFAGGGVQTQAKGTANVKAGKGKAAPAPAAKGGGAPSPALMAALPSLMAMMGGGGGGRGGAPMPSPQGAPFAMGGAVPGQGSGKVDTVPAMLAPGEAVLNKAAAEMVGRDRIAKANAAGRAKMGGMPKPVAGGHAGGITTLDNSGGTHLDNSAAPAPTPGYAGNPSIVRSQFEEAPRVGGGGFAAAGGSMAQASPIQTGDFALPNRMTTIMGPQNGGTMFDSRRPVPLYAGGTEEVTGKPGPGQTQTNGSWGGQNQGLRLQLGMGTPAPKPTPVPKPQGFAGGAKKVEPKGPDFFKGYAKGATDVHATLRMFGKGLAKPKPVAAGRGMV